MVFLGDEVSQRTKLLLWMHTEMMIIVTTMTTMFRMGTASAKMEMTSMYTCVQKCTSIDDDAVVKGMTYFLTEPPIKSVPIHMEMMITMIALLKSEFYCMDRNKNLYSVFFDIFWFFSSSLLEEVSGNH